MGEKEREKMQQSLVFETVKFGRIVCAAVLANAGVPARGMTIQGYIM